MAVGVRLFYDCDGVVEAKLDGLHKSFLFAEISELPAGNWRDTLRAIHPVGRWAVGKNRRTWSVQGIGTKAAAKRKGQVGQCAGSPCSMPDQPRRAENSVLNTG